MILDHLFLFADEAAAHAALDALGFGFPATDDYPAGWDGSRMLTTGVIMDWTITTDADGNELREPVLMPGFHINAGLMELRDDLIAMPECVLITDRDKGTAPGATRADYLIHTKVSVETMDAVKGFTRLHAGSHYPLG